MLLKIMLILRMKKTIRDILNHLEMSYVGARAMDDVEIMCRIERAIAVMNPPAIPEVFLPDSEENMSNEKLRAT